MKYIKDPYFHKIDIRENLEILVGHYDKAICPGSWLFITIFVP